MKSIGLIDFYLDEYHAHAAVKNAVSASEKLGCEFKVTSAYAECDNESGMTSAEFVEKYGLARKSSIKELCESVDFVMILAPDHNGKKEEYAIEAIKYGKPIFMDKTFTDSYASAVRIFDAADKAGVPMFSSSSLRYAAELDKYKGDCVSVLVTGSGVELEMYAVHYLEIIISAMGCDVASVRHENRGQQEWFHLEYRDGRRATAAISMGEYLDFKVFLADKDGITADFSVLSDIFGLQMEAIIRFFLSGEASFAREETLTLMKVFDAIFESKRGNGKCVSL